MQQGVVEPEGRRMHLTGQVAWDADGTVLHPGDAKAQTHAAFDHIVRILAAAGGTLNDVVSMNTYLIDPADWPAISSARAERLDPVHGPASTAVVVAGLADPALLVELQCIAIIPENRLQLSD